jgi:hypothetical protein
VRREHRDSALARERIAELTGAELELRSRHRVEHLPPERHHAVVQLAQAVVAAERDRAVGAARWRRDLGRLGRHREAEIAGVEPHRPLDVVALVALREDGRVGDDVVDLAHARRAEVAEPGRLDGRWLSREDAEPRARRVAR